MEFFYEVGQYEEIEILGSHLYYTQSEFKDIINKIKADYNRLESDLDDNVSYNWKIENEIFGWQDYLVYRLGNYGIFRLDINAKEIE